MADKRKIHQPTDTPKSAPASIALSGWLVVVVAIVVVGLAWYLAYSNKGFKIALDKSGKLEIEVRADETFSELLTKALKKNQSEIDAILASHQYYNLANADFVDQLERLDSSRPETKEISNRLRKLLWDLRGPFEIPYTLIGADERMSRALDALETARRNSKQANALLVKLWRESLQGEGIFLPRSFDATVEIVQGARSGKILACPGDAIATVGGIVMLLTTEDGGAITHEVEQNPAMFHCDGFPLTAEKLLAVGGMSRLGLSATDFRNLVTGSEREISDGRIHATLRLYPKNVTGIQAQVGE